MSSTYLSGFGHPSPLSRNGFPYVASARQASSRTRRVSVFLFQDDRLFSAQMCASCSVICAHTQKALNRTGLPVLPDYLLTSVYDGSNWSNPEEVCNDGCFDGEFSYYVENDNTVYVVFQKGNMIFGDDTEYSDVVRNIDPYVTKFDGSTFSTPEKVRDDNNSYEDNNYEAEWKKVKK